MITMIVALVIIGLCLYLIETYIPLSPPIQVVLRVLVVLFSVLWLLSAFGLIDPPFRTLR